MIPRVLLYSKRDELKIILMHMLMVRLIILSLTDHKDDYEGWFDLQYKQVDYGHFLGHLPPVLQFGLDPV